MQLIKKKKQQQETDSDEEKPSSTRSKKGEDYVIVKYEEEYFPGIIEDVDSALSEISTMIFSTENIYQWPENCDNICYQKYSIIEKISVLTLTNRQGFYQVPEMDKSMQKIDYCSYFFILFVQA